MAEHEAKAISERTTAALARTKARGVKLGGGRGHMPRIAAQGHTASLAARRAKAAGRAADLLPVIREAREAGATTLQAVANALNAKGIPTARGKTWSPTQV